MRHSIGDVSRLLGMTTSALHYYEKEGVIDTPKVESGRRYYEEADVYRLVSAKKYRAMGVSLKEIAEQFGTYGMGAEQVIARMGEKREEAQRLSVQYAKLAEDIARLESASREGMDAVGVVDLRRAEDVLVLCTPSGSIAPEDKGQQELVRSWLEAMPAVGIGVIRRNGRASLGYTILEERAKDFGFEPDGQLVFLVKGGMALHAVIRCGDEVYARPEGVFAALDSFAREHRFDLADAACAGTLFVDCSAGRKDYYFDVYAVLA